MMDLNDIMALARGEGSPHLVKPKAKPYEEGNIGRLLSYWKKFAGEVLQSPEREKQQAAPLENDVPMHFNQAYLAWRVKYGQGRIDGKAITVQTLKKEFQQIVEVIAYETGKTWLAKDIAEMRRVTF
ncbi:uncharacterized protein M421DRAFT_8453 [Didymella exigua CBS 183.55]|uniref:Uncharacterized protein n=1 Tax=Didymella exigua CBS 183.55 TaxID=1150837 RepID=A0A6A5RAY7_9PLEO|nr:uncharacterized protein M421DRAFT_8453 [Didymella exigua CBS 183.55]KAF1924802.1 hypothetical protein M421DRAFT_8453 [Didymella exigua CBS 183.55]